MPNLSGRPRTPDPGSGRHGPEHLVRGLVALGAALVLAGSACTARSGATSPTPRATPPTPAPTPPPEPRFSGTDGRSLYGQACSVCHGQALEGTNAGPTFLNRIYAPGHHADISFMFAIERGVRAHHWNFGNMAPVEGLSQEQVLAIIAFIREEQRAAGIE